MAGNVAEWVADVYRPIVDDEFNDFNYFRGNDYKKFKIGEDGKAVIATEAKYKTLPNGKRIATTLPEKLNSPTLKTLMFDSGHNLTKDTTLILEMVIINPLEITNLKIVDSPGPKMKTLKRVQCINLLNILMQIQVMTNLIMILTKQGQL